MKHGIGQIHPRHCMRYATVHFYADEPFIPNGKARARRETHGAAAVSLVLPGADWRSSSTQDARMARAQGKCLFRRWNK